MNEGLIQRVRERRNWSEKKERGGERWKERERKRGKEREGKITERGN